MIHTRWFLAGAWVALITVAACGDDVYAACETADDCEVPQDADAVCLDKSGQGFCSWLCNDDSDCEDDLDDEFDYVCASFENNPDLYCFPSCEDGTCPGGWGCRSTGGGANNRQVCSPDEGGDDPPID